MVIALFLGRRPPSRPPPLAARFAAAGLDRDRRPRIWLGMPSTGRKEPPRQWVAASLMVTKRSRPETLALDGVPAIRERVTDMDTGGGASSFSTGASSGSPA